MSVLDLHAEKFAASGAMAADGMKKLLGTPALTVLQTVLREAVQNSWDARLPDEQVEFHISLRSLSSKEKRALKDRVLAELPPHKGSSGPLREFFRADESIVMELSDWGTRGLGGPTRADVVPARGEPSDFVNFVRNIGVRRDTAQGGGTYGYGKTSLYSMSRCSTVLIDTLAVARSGKPQRRFIACHLGDANDIGRSMRLTGRHWWGRQTGREELVEPVTGREATALADAIGLSARGSDETGTTLMILDPETGDRSLEEVAADVQETLLWFLWPKMLAGADGPAIKFVLLVDGEEIDIPVPEAFPPLDLFIEAYRAVKGAGPDVQEIWSEKPMRLLGHCAVRRGFRAERTLLTDQQNSIIPHTASHIALMRPVELVVKYVQGTSLPSEAHEWAGVFICSDDPEVEQAFADSEPPAHDDWIPDKMPKGWAKTYVRVALREIRHIAQAYAYPDLEAGGIASAQPSIARAAERLGDLIPFGTNPDSGGGGGGRPGGGSGGGGTGGRRRTRWHVGEPRFAALEEGPEGGEAIFELEVSNDTSPSLKITAVPLAIIDGSLAAGDETDARIIPLLGWENFDGSRLQSSATLSVAAGTQGTFRIRIGVPDDTAVGLKLRITDAEPA